MNVLIIYIGANKTKVMGNRSGNKDTQEGTREQV
jgi:hypothetical protein